MKALFTQKNSGKICLPTPYLYGVFSSLMQMARLPHTISKKNTITLKYLFLERLLQADTSGLF